MYNDLRSSVRFNNVMTNSFSVESGVRQGDNLALTLFTLYINDLIPVIKGVVNCQNSRDKGSPEGNSARG